MEQASNGTVVIRSDEEKSEIHEQLNRVLASSYFKNSKRYPMLLRHVVEKTLQGQTDDLKERSIGFEVFQKSADYDTNNDNVVRITAGEIRKRLAQYYQEPGHENELRIDLPAGAYVPVFHVNGNVETSAAAIPLPLATPMAMSADTAAASADTNLVVAEPLPVSTRWRWLWSAVAVVLVGLAIWFGLRRDGGQAKDSLSDFWSPVLAAQGQVLFCVPIMHVDPSALPASGVKPDDRAGVISLTQYDEMMNRVSLADAIALTRIAAVTQARGKTYVVKGDKFATLTDLRGGPVVLIGAFDNDWTLRLSDQLRYVFEKNQTTGMLHVRDRQNMGFDDWKLDGRTGYTKVTNDYAIVARFQDKTTEQLVVLAAGLGQYGTLAAGEVLSNPKYLQPIFARAPKEWAGVNFEAVFTTQVISGNNGPPHELAVRFW